MGVKYMAKNLDGITKLNPEEIKKYRKIVLNYIGEEDSVEVNEKKAFAPAAVLLKKVDGLNPHKVTSTGKNEASVDIHSGEDESAAAAERQAVTKKNISLEKPKRLAEKAETRRLAELARRKTWSEKKKKHREAIRKFKIIFDRKAKGFCLIIKRNFIYSASISVIFLLIIYLIFCLSVLRFGVDNNISRQALKYFPVPAAITNQGIISYGDFKIIRNKNYSDFNFDEKKNYLAGQAILSNLKQKYGLPADTAIADLAIKYVLDRDFNQIGLSRITKIKMLLKNHGGIEQLFRYADKYNGEDYYSGKIVMEKFGSKALELAIGQVSDIIYRTDGYYIVERIDDKSGQIGLKYIFIGAETLEQYVNKESVKIKVFILAD